MAKRFFFVSAGVLCLMVSALIGFHLGSAASEASPPPKQQIAGFHHVTGFDTWAVIEPDGDVWVNRSDTVGPFAGPAQLKGNFWTGSTIPSDR